MITLITERDLFQEQEKNHFSGGDILILASEEYINQSFKIISNDKDPQILLQEQIGLAQKFFNEIRSDKDYLNKYKIVQGKNDLKIIILTTTDEGFNNTLNYIRDLIQN